MNISGGEKKTAFIYITTEVPHYHHICNSGVAFHVYGICPHY